MTLIPLFSETPCSKDNIRSDSIPPGGIAQLHFPDRKDLPILYGFRLRLNACDGFCGELLWLIYLD